MTARSRRGAPTLDRRALAGHRRWRRWACGHDGMMAAMATRRGAVVPSDRSSDVLRAFRPRRRTALANALAGSLPLPWRAHRRRAPPTRRSRRELCGLDCATRSGSRPASTRPAATSTPSVRSGSATSWAARSRERLGAGNRSPRIARSHAAPLDRERDGPAESGRRGGRGHASQPGVAGRRRGSSASRTSSSTTPCRRSSCSSRSPTASSSTRAAPTCPGDATGTTSRIFASWSGRSAPARPKPVFVKLPPFVSDAEREVGARRGAWSYARQAPTGSRARTRGPCGTRGSPTAAAASRGEHCGRTRPDRRGCAARRPAATCRSTRAAASSRPTMR